MNTVIDGADWDYAHGLLSTDQVEVPSLGTRIPAWFNIERARAKLQRPSPKQLAAWREFGALPAKSVTAALQARVAVAEGAPALHITTFHVVIPQQDRTPLRLVSVHVDIDGAALEAIFADGELVHLGDDSGLWARSEWPEFNDPLMTREAWLAL
jgi:hypothetical protein